MEKSWNYIDQFVYREYQSSIVNETLDESESATLCDKCAIARGKRSAFASSSV